MNKAIISIILFSAVAVALASATVGLGYRSNYYSAYPGYQYYQSYGPNYAPSYRSYSYQAGVVPAYSSYQPYYQPYYGSYYGPSYLPYAPFAAKA